LAVQKVTKAEKDLPIAKLCT